MSERQNQGQSSGRILQITVLVALALVHRLLIALWTTTIATDSSSYLTMARLFSQGKVQQALEAYTFHPFFPFLTATTGTLLGSLERGGYAVSIMASSLAVVSLFFFVRLVWNERIAFWSCLLYALHPTLALESSDVMTTGLFLALFTTALALGSHALRGTNWALYPLAGLTAGLSYLTRPEAVLLGGFFAAALLLAVWRAVRGSRSGSPADGGEEQPRLQRWGHLAVGTIGLVTICALTVLPYSFWSHTTRGQWLTARDSSRYIRDGIQDALTRTSSPPPSAPVPSPPTAPAMATIPTGPEGTPPSPSKATPSPAVPAFTAPKAGRIRHLEEPTFAKISFTGYRRMVSAFSYPVLALILLGLILGFRERSSRVARLYLLLMAIACLIPPFLLIYLSPYHHMSPRYLLTGVVLLLPWAAAGFVAIIDAIERFLRARAGPERRMLLRWVPLGILATAFLVKSVGPRRPEEITFLEAGQWLKEQSRGTPLRIATTAEKIAWYGDCSYSPLQPGQINEQWVYRNKTWERYTGQAGLGPMSEGIGRTMVTYQKAAAHYLVLDQGTVQHYYYPEFPQELEKVGFQLAATFEGPRKTGLKVWIYRLEGPGD